MHDLKYIRKNPEEVYKKLIRRGYETTDVNLAGLLHLDARKRQYIAKVEAMAGEKKKIAKEIGKAGTIDGKDDLIRKSKELDVKMASYTEAINGHLDLINAMLSGMPNIPDDSVPDGNEPDQNVEVRRIGKIPSFDFTPRNHADLGIKLSGMDFEQAGKVSGSRFVYLKGDLAKLERALGQYMLEVQTAQNGYTEVNPPLLVNEHSVYGVGQLPKFAEGMFRTGDNRWLIPTAEVSLTNLVREKIVMEKDLPLRYVALTPCFRSEAGSSGKDTYGMIRQHQFNKVELVTICHPEKSDEELHRMTNCAEFILYNLELPYRVVLLCAGDMGFASRKTYDIEVWLPSQNTYREISSCSNCGDFQARRISARYSKVITGVDPKFVHTLNGSGLAVGRTLVAVLENYQQEDGSIVIPRVLRPYMKIDIIKRCS